MCRPMTIDMALNRELDGKVALIPRVVKFTDIRRSGSTPPKGQSNTTILTLSSFIEEVAMSVSNSGSFLIAQKESMVTIVTQTECPVH